MSKPKYKKGDWVVIKPNVDLYGGKMGRIINVTPPHFSSNIVTIYTVEFDDGCVDDFTGLELKTPTTEMLQEHVMGRLDGGFVTAEQLSTKDTKEDPEKTPVMKDIDWSDFKSEADKEWESFAK